MKNKKVALLILDGWGIGDKSYSDAIFSAHTPVMDRLQKEYPHSVLHTSGMDVGLPEGQMGNSEVGHLNIGAGRIVYQDLVKINLAIKNKILDENKALIDCFHYVKSNGKRIHLMGLLSDGCIHSSDQHLYYLIDLIDKNCDAEYFIHAFTDGRDTDPKSGKGFIEKLMAKLRGRRGRLATIIGRYYAMDRDKRWERIKIAWEMLVNASGFHSQDPLLEVQSRYEKGETDEFLNPIVVSEVDGRILPGDVVICFNYRTDRCREITMALSQNDFPDFGMKTIPLYFVTMTNYDESFKNVHVIFERENLTETLGEVISREGKTQLRIAETEKYPHVSFFFSGGREKPFDAEFRIMVPSPKVATYDLQPEMSADMVRDAAITFVEQNHPDFICLNFANPDMVGHTGVYSAIIKAIEKVDSCLGSLISVLKDKAYSIIIIADHGNPDVAINADGTPNTAHSTNPVPCILIDSDFREIRDGKLADIAPTILQLMHIPKPIVMTGNTLLP